MKVEQSSSRSTAEFKPGPHAENPKIAWLPSNQNGPSIWSLGYLSLMSCLSLSLGLVLYYLKSISPFVSLPADILMWAETSFVGDIIKLRSGVPLYTLPSDSNSSIYTPAAPVVTYVIAWLAGKSTSIVAYRIIQLGFVLCATVIATLCCRTLYKCAYPGDRIAFPKTLNVFTFLVLFLAATAPRTSAFVHVLHADALALLVSMFSFWTMLLYLESPSWKRILLMAVCPALGYVSKQFLISWAAVMFVFLLMHQPRKLKSAAVFAVVATALISIAVGGCYLLWGRNFTFWTFEVMGGPRKAIGVSPAVYNISLARSLDHLVRAWLEISSGIIGGWLILRESNVRKLGPLWVAWLVLVASEAFSSGAGWGVLYHFGPGVLIGAVWLLAACMHQWPSPIDTTLFEFPQLTRWLRPLGAAACALTMFATLRVLPTSDRYEARYWQRRPSPDVYRYISEIEREFDGIPVDKVLLDVGNWLYLQHSFLAKDRAVSLADQPPGGIYENFEGLLQRIHDKAYEKILVRDFHSPLFLYDWEGWSRSSGVRKALLERYTEVRTISAAQGENMLPPMIMHTGPVSVLTPKPNSDHTSTKNGS